MYIQKNTYYLCIKARTPRSPSLNLPLNLLSGFTKTFKKVVPKKEIFKYYELYSLYMIEIKTKLRRWGNSFGIVVPLKAMENEKIREGDEITALISERKNKVDLRKLFNAKVKFKKTTEEMMGETDRELHNG